mgnify:CR=1 FL=1
MDLCFLDHLGNMDLTALIARALDVKVGLQAVYDGIFPFPPTYKLEVPQTSEFTSHVEVSGSFPILVVPMK